MKKIFVAVIVSGLLIVYSIYQKLSTTPAQGNTSTSTNSTSNTNTGSNLSLASTSSTGQTSTTYKDGTYTGSTEDAYYGSVQVQATVSNGKISNVQFLQYPTDRRTSQMINSQATSMLSSEAIQAQSANVNIVSGATDTSLAFIQSLTVALQNAVK